MTTNIPTPTVQLEGLRLGLDGVDTVSINPDHTGAAVQASIGCAYFDIVGLKGGIDLYVDDEGAINGSPFNVFATVLAHAYGVPAVLFGTAVALSVNTDTGESVSLTVQESNAIIDAITDRPFAPILDDIVASLTPYPTVIAMMKSM